MGATSARRRQTAMKAAKATQKNTKSDLGIITKPMTKVPPGAQKEMKSSKKKG